MSHVPPCWIINYLTYANADFRRQSRARKLRNGQSTEGHRQAAAIVTKGFPMDVLQPWRYYVRRDGENKKRNRNQESASVNGDPCIRNRDSFCNCYMFH